MFYSHLNDNRNMRLYNMKQLYNYILQTDLAESTTATLYTLTRIDMLVKSQIKSCSKVEKRHLNFAFNKKIEHIEQT